MNQPAFAQSLVFQAFSCASNATHELNGLQNSDSRLSSISVKNYYAETRNGHKGTLEHYENLVFAHESYVNQAYRSPFETEKRNSRK